MPDDVVFQLSSNGKGPPPEDEILFHNQTAEEYGYTWVGLPRAANQNRIELGVSHAYLMAPERKASRLILRGVVTDVSNQKPNDKLLADFYRGHAFDWWWRLTTVECIDSNLDALCLRKAEDGDAYNTAFLTRRFQPMVYVHDDVNWPSDRVGDVDPGKRTTILNISDDFAAPQTAEVRQAIFSTDLFKATLAADRTTIHAVDWSGGSEFEDANEKIRYARWDSAGVTVEPPNLSRSKILEMVLSTPGLWLIDFPLGCLGNLCVAPEFLPTIMMLF